MTSVIKVKCIHCGSNDVRKCGKSRGNQRYECHNSCGKSFQLEYKNKGWLPTVRSQIQDMAINGSGIRDTARVLKVSPSTVMWWIKKKPQISLKSIGII